MANETDAADAAGERLALEKRLVTAEARLARALQRLHALRHAALFGSFSTDEYESTLLEHRSAERAADDARRQWRQWWQRRWQEPGAPQPDTPQPALALPPAEPTAAFAPTKRHEFARWLYQTGRISDEA